MPPDLISSRLARMIVGLAPKAKQCVSVVSRGTPSVGRPRGAGSIGL